MSLASFLLQRIPLLEERQLVRVKIGDAGKFRRDDFRRRVLLRLAPAELAAEHGEEGIDRAAAVEGVRGGMKADASLPAGDRRQELFFPAWVTGGFLSLPGCSRLPVA